MKTKSDIDSPLKDCFLQRILQMELNTRELWKEILLE